MGAFIPVTLDNTTRIPDYEEELELLTNELQRNSSLQLSQFCSSRGISYQGFKGYLDSHRINLKQFRMQTTPKSSNLTSEILADVFIKLPNQVEIRIASILPTQLSDLLKSL